MAAGAALHAARAGERICAGASGESAGTVGVGWLTASSAVAQPFCARSLK